MATIKLTQILITSLHTGGSEQETQAVIDMLQEKGWRVTWGIGPSQFCTEDEQKAFEKDFKEAVMSCVPYSKEKVKAIEATQEEYAKIEALSELTGFEDEDRIGKQETSRQNILPQIQN